MVARAPSKCQLERAQSIRSAQDDEGPGQLEQYPPAGQQTGESGFVQLALLLHGVFGSWSTQLLESPAPQQSPGLPCTTVLRLMAAVRRRTTNKRRLRTFRI